jgi:hypothetical protein
MTMLGAVGTETLLPRQVWPGQPSVHLHAPASQRLFAIVLSTHLVYPIRYDGLVAAEPVSVLVLTTPNALLVMAAGRALLAVSCACVPR